MEDQKHKPPTATPCLPPVLRDIHADETDHVVVPFSTANLEKIEEISNFHSPLFQGILFYTHNHFEINLWVDRLVPTAPGITANLPRERIEVVLVQFAALYNLCQSGGPDFIDFRVLQLLPGDRPRFPICWDSLPSPPLNSKRNSKRNSGRNSGRNPGGAGDKNQDTTSPPLEILDIFRSNPHLAGLTVHDFAEMTGRLNATHRFGKDELYVYRYDDFASAFLRSHPVTGLQQDACIKIRINTVVPHQKQLVKLHLCRGYISDDVFLADLTAPPNAEPRSLAAAVAGLLPGDPATRPDFLSIVRHLDDFLRRPAFKSPFRSMVLLLDQIHTEDDARFTDFLRDSVRTGRLPVNLALVCLGTPGDRNRVDFDLELNENPPNLLSSYLRFDQWPETPPLSPAESWVLKMLLCLPEPPNHDELGKILRPDHADALGTLLERGLVSADSGGIFFNGDAAALGITLSEEEEKEILEFFLHKGTRRHGGIEVKYFMVTGRIEQLKDCLRQLNNPGTGDGTGDGARKVIHRNLHLLEGHLDGDLGLVELLVESLIAEHRLRRARELIARFSGPSGSVTLQLKLALICRWEKDLREMDRLLADLEKALKKNKGGARLEGRGADEYHYLRFAYYERVSDLRRAEEHLDQVKDRLYRERANVLLIDRYIYRGDFGGADRLLDGATAYFKSRGTPPDEIEALSYRGKILRQKQDFEGAERLYQELFMRCEQGGYRLLAAYIAADLANLYWVRDEFVLSHGWHRKILDIFRELDNENGIMMTLANLAEFNKIQGLWQQAGQDLEKVLEYDKKKQALTSCAVDYFNIAHLEYLKRRFSRTREFIGLARAAFEKTDHWWGVIECDVLGLKLDLLDDRVKTMDRAVFDARAEQMPHDHTVLVEIAGAVLDPPRQWETVITGLLDRLKSNTHKYEILCSVIHRRGGTGLLEYLKKLSMLLGKNTKNYYYFEYYYIYYTYFTEPGKLGEDEIERFNEVYYFFLTNRRNLSPAMARHRQVLDQREARYDVFKSAELVGDSSRWKTPRDFFDSLAKELDHALPFPLDLVRLVIRESGKEGEPLFDFSRPDQFTTLSGEIIGAAARELSSLSLSPEEVKARVECPEKAFYACEQTLVFPWKISDALFGMLLLGFSPGKYRGYDVQRRHRDLLNKFASLVHRFYETDYKVGHRLGFIIGASAAVRRLKEQIHRVSKVDFSLLVRGESGSGKELVARAAHLLSGRSAEPFVPVNAAAIPENLLEAELFGYKKGAFTGANEHKTGLIEAAHKGTLFLDEIADLPLGLQAKLLRALQENEIRRLGETNTRTVDVRLISATNKDLQHMIAGGQFREDLFFRIQDLTITVPPLRKRLEDLPLLVHHFLEKYRFPIKEEDQLQRIFDHFSTLRWDGNVRELESRVKRLITYYPDFEMPDDEGDDGDLGDHDDHGDIGTPGENGLSGVVMSSGVGGEEGLGLVAERGLIGAREELERRLILDALEAHEWNRGGAAAFLKISRQYLFNLTRKYGLTKN